MTNTTGQSVADAMLHEHIDMAKQAARAFADSLGRSPSKRELAAFMSGFLAALEVSA